MQDTWYWVLSTQYSVLGFTVQGVQEVQKVKDRDNIKQWNVLGLISLVMSAYLEEERRKTSDHSVKGH